MIRFLDPQWLWLLALLPVFAFLRGRRGAVAAVEYSSAQRIRAVARETRSRAGAWLGSMKLSALGMIIVALARPQLGSSIAPVQASGVDIMLALDVSGSMQAVDFKLGGQSVDRLDVVKSVVSKFIEARPNDRIGIVAFAGAPYLVSPLTLDHDWLLQNLARVRVGAVEDGTAIGSAIASSVNRLSSQAGKSKLVVLLTDGQNNAGKVSPATAAQAARAMGMKVYTIGVGSRGEAPVPVTDAFGNRRLVMAKVDVDETTLQKIADETSARFYRATDTDSLRRIYADIDRLERTTHTLRRFESQRELFSWAVLPGLALMGLTLGLEQTRFRRLPA
jgi:Ca-activated chloride channel family protein